jgi:hypothetical protein
MKVHRGGQKFKIDDELKCFVWPAEGVCNIMWIQITMKILYLSYFQNLCFSRGVMFDAWTTVMREWFLPYIGAHRFCLLAVKFMRFLWAYLENSQETTILAMLKFNLELHVSGCSSIL